MESRQAKSSPSIRFTLRQTTLESVEGGRGWRARRTKSTGTRLAAPSSSLPILQPLRQARGLFPARLGSLFPDGCGLFGRGLRFGRLLCQSKRLQPLGLRQNGRGIGFVFRQRLPGIVGPLDLGLIARCVFLRLICQCALLSATWSKRARTINPCADPNIPGSARTARAARFLDRLA
jgi:hypothetical protein